MIAAIARSTTAQNLARPVPRVLTISIHLALAGLMISPAHAAEDASRDSALPQISVTADRASRSTSLSADDLQNAGVTDMAGVIRYQPLVSAPSALSGAANLWDGSGTSGYNIRGVEGNRVGLDIDGIELPAAVPLPDGLKATGVGIGRDYIDPEVFRRVDIISGTTSSGENGATGLGGRVSFQTRSPDDYLSDGKNSYLGAKLGYTSADQAWAESLTTAQKMGDWKLLALYSNRDGALTRSKDVSDANRDNWHSDAVLFKAFYEGLAHHKLGVTLDLYDRADNRYLDGSTYSAYPAGATQYSTTRRHRLQVEDEYTPAAGSIAAFDKLRVHAFYQDSKKEDYTIAANSTNSYTRYIDTYLTTTSVGLGADASKRMGTHELFYGLSFTSTDEQRPWTEARITNATGNSVSGYPYSKDRMAQTRTNKLVAYVRDEWHLSPRATLTPGLRAEYWQTRPGDLSHYLANVGSAASEVSADHTALLAPSLRFAYALTPSYDFFAQYSRGVRVATAAEKTGTYDSSTYASSAFLYAILGNPDLKNETSDAFELGTKGELIDGLTLNSSLFYTRYKNFIDYQTTTYSGTSLAYRLQNIANVDIYGAEVSAQLRLGTYASALRGYSLGGSAGVSAGRSRNDAGVSGSVNSVGPAKGTVRVAYDDPGARYGGSLIMTAVKSKRASADDVSVYSTSGAYVNVPGYALLDLSTYWKLNQHVTLHAGIYNLTDRKYWDYATVRGLTTSQSVLFQRAAQPGRNAAITLNIDL